MGLVLSGRAIYLMTVMSRLLKGHDIYISLSSNDAALQLLSAAADYPDNSELQELQQKLCQEIGMKRIKSAMKRIGRGKELNVTVAPQDMLTPDASGRSHKDDSSQSAQRVYRGQLVA